MRNSVIELMRISPVADQLATLFHDAGHELYLVGGSVRDALLGRLAEERAGQAGQAERAGQAGAAQSEDRGKPEDLDFTTDARPEQIMDLVRGWADAVWETGIEFGTVSLRKNGTQLEITTFRADSYDRVGRHPDVVFGNSITDDLMRRDFTVNAMAIELGAKTFVDPFGGLEALARGELDTPAPPEESFADDPLRMLRAARFVSHLGFTVHQRVFTAMTEMAGEIERISAERVQGELTKLMLGDQPRRGIELMTDSGLAEYVLPEVPGMRLAIDEHHQHKDVYEHSLTVLDQAIDLETKHEPASGPDLVLRLAALLHDIGKPDTRKFEPGGGVSFHHHEVVGARMARKRLRKLRYSKEVISDVSQLVYLHLRFHGYGKGEWTDSAVRRYVTDAGHLLTRLHKLVRADCTTRNKRKAASLQRNYDDLEERIARIKAEEDLAKVRPDLDGNEIMAILGLEPGPLVGKAWQHLKNVRLDRGPLDREEAIAELHRWAEEQGIR
ncbi:CCA tRNA nucleotidyltransferase [Haloechinothrix sp. LS1_15]|uniref:CCA tRNA nucleotidyltransferase n=1 Tax=Haloechinothrix sp. LS1_15 TaxID=2652248 RepID=UPI0029457809|nr:CCA tRNA nucleotidyltransferase [Haloechinothrix sp. LS1_15]MDV6010994.1 CCA tRNA nucleotidyltransferase [Haloechinothrix sp. LS1_15]